MLPLINSAATGNSDESHAYEVEVDEVEVALCNGGQAYVNVNWSDAVVSRAEVPRWPKMRVLIFIVSVIAVGTSFMAFGKLSSVSKATILRVVDGWRMLDVAVLDLWKMSPTTASVASDGEPIAKISFGVLPHFHGSTPQFDIEPGGRLSAEIHASSNGTAFLFDHRVQYILDGQVHMSDGTGKQVLGKAGDLFYTPYGSNVSYYTPHSARIYVVSVDQAHSVHPGTPSAYQKWMYDSAKAVPISHFPNIKDRASKRFQAYASKRSPTSSSAFFDEVGCFKFKGSELPSGSKPSWNFCCGAFYLGAGPSFTSYAYKHHYEIDFLLDGELRFKEANGRRHLAKKGDLVHNPRHMNAAIETPTMGKFLTVSLSEVDNFRR